MTQFTANEVRACKKALASVSGTGAAQEMLHAFADMLEAREKAVPVATVVDQFGFPLMEWIGNAGDRCPVGTKLYTHPSPSDAERLAEALRRTCRKMKTFSRTGALDGAVAVWVDEIESVLATHSAQAQPPAASVPEMTGLTWEPPNVTVDVERVGRFRSGDEHIVIVTFRSSDDGRRMTCFYSANKSAAEYLHAMLAAQENPNG